MGWMWVGCWLAVATPSKQAPLSACGVTPPENDEVAVEVDVRHDEGVWSGEIAVWTADGVSRRAFTATTCSEVDAAIDLLVALHGEPWMQPPAIEPQPEHSPTASEAPSVDIPDPAPIDVGPQSTARRPAELLALPGQPGVEQPGAEVGLIERASPPQSRERDLQAVFGVGAGVGSGPVPRALAVVMAHVGIQGRQWAAMALGKAWLPSQHHFGDVGARFTQWTVGGRGCWVPHHRRLAFPVCTGLDAGLMHGRGQSVTRPAKTRRPLVAIPVSGAVRWAPTPSVGLFAGIELSSVLLRPHFAVQGSSSTYTVPWWALWGGAGVQLHFP